MTREQRRGYRIEIRGPAPLSNSANELAPDASSSGPDAETNEILLIDDRAVPYITTQQGVRIYYQPPEADLVAAARCYVDSQREKPE